MYFHSQIRQHFQSKTFSLKSHHLGSEITGNTPRGSLATVNNNTHSEPLLVKRYSKLIWYFYSCDYYACCLIYCASWFISGPSSLVPIVFCTYLYPVYFLHRKWWFYQPEVMVLLTQRHRQKKKPNCCYDQVIVALASMCATKKMYGGEKKKEDGKVDCSSIGQTSLQAWRPFSWLPAAV